MADTSNSTENRSEEQSVPWMTEARLRKVRAPQGEAEKLQQEREPERPAWMKDALAKKKRNAELVQEKGP